MQAAFRVLSAASMAGNSTGDADARHQQPGRTGAEARRFITGVNPARHGRLGRAPSSLRGGQIQTDHHDKFFDIRVAGLLISIALGDIRHAERLRQAESR